jgi:hypothetical protein
LWPRRNSLISSIPFFLFLLCGLTCCCWLVFIYLFYLKDNKHKKKKNWKRIFWLVGCVYMRGLVFVNDIKEWMLHIVNLKKKRCLEVPFKRTTGMVVIYSLCGWWNFDKVIKRWKDFRLKLLKLIDDSPSTPQ